MRAPRAGTPPRAPAYRWSRAPPLRSAAWRPRQTPTQHYETRTATAAASDPPRPTRPSRRARRAAAARDTATRVGESAGGGRVGWRVQRHRLAAGHRRMHHKPRPSPSHLIRLSFSDENEGTEDQEEEEEEEAIHGR
eukprot:ctg_1139.g395